VFDYHVEQLWHIAKSRFERQVLIDEILELRKSLSGNAVHVLGATYFSLKLHKDSRKKLHSIYWATRAQGIRELSVMNYQYAVPWISVFLSSSNRVLREESVMALVRIRSSNSFRFLEIYRGEITPWMCINIHHHLQTWDSRNLPQFSRWFSSKNESVILFCLKMARDFGQTQAIPQILELCRHTRKEIAADAIDSIRQLEAFEYRDEVVKLTHAHHNDPWLLSKVIRCLGDIGVPEKDLEIVLPYLNHKDYEVRFQSARSLTKLGFSLQQLTSLEVSESAKKIITHVSDPLLPQ